MSRLALQPLRRRRGRSARSAGGRGAGREARHPHQQCGCHHDNLLMRMKDEEFEEVIRINLEAAFRLMRAAAKPMMKARFGRIISITSVVGVTGNPGQANYVASKAGADRHDQGGRAGAREPGITVNAVAPGFMTSAMTDALNEQQREASCRAFRSGAMGSGEDIGAAWSILRRRRRATSPARRCTSMAAWRCREAAVKRSLRRSLSLDSSHLYPEEINMFGRLDERADLALPGQDQADLRSRRGLEDPL